MKSKHIAIFLPSLAGGGVANVMVQLLQAFSELDIRVDLILCKKVGPFLHQVPRNITITELKAEPAWKARLRLGIGYLHLLPYLLLPILFAVKPPKILRYLADLEWFIRVNRPDAILSAKTHANLGILLVHPKVRSLTHIVISERGNLLKYSQSSKRWRWRFIFPLVKKVYPLANKIITVSQGMAEDLVCHGHLNQSLMTTIYNPIQLKKVQELSQRKVSHPWGESNQAPVILGVGRLTEQKDFPTLLRAFCTVRQNRSARLILLGEGKKRPELEALAKELSIREDVWMPGFVENPYAYMATAAVFVLSSVTEGFPNVLLEALACGCPVVSTDCPNGPREILQEGSYGHLVPMRDPEFLAKAILSTIDYPPSANYLQNRAAEFDLQNISQQYLKALLEKESQANYH